MTNDHCFHFIEENHCCINRKALEKECGVGWSRWLIVVYVVGVESGSTVWDQVEVYEVYMT